MTLLFQPIRVLMVAIALCSSSAMADCAQCERLGADLSKAKADLEKNESYLGKNRLFLGALSAQEASKFLKVTGNVTVILKKMERIKAQIAELNDKLDKEGCIQCKTENQ